MTEYGKEYERWLNSGVLTASERGELLGIREDEEEIALRFGAPMSFGTAGLRSVMKLGIGCMNTYTVAQATAGIADLILSENGASRGAVIACDSRNNSTLFARTAAEVLAAKGIRVYIFDDIRPTPELSFAVRELHCLAGINITASHNPKEYNGYKAYWEDGAQISPEQAKTVSAAISKTDVLTGAPRKDFDLAVSEGIVTVLDSEFDERYLSAVLKTAIQPNAVAAIADDLKIVYSPLHGAGRVLVPEIFKRLGLKYIHTVPEQMVADGNFPTVKKPNPEYADVFALGIEIAEKVGSDLVIATDPDADRIGVMSRDKDGKFVTITGNQMGALLLDYVIEARRATGTLGGDDYAVKSIVSTDLAYRIASVQGIRLHDVLTGFKFIGGVIKDYEDNGRDGSFLLGFEESYGYLFGSYARDKDAVGAALMICEMTAHYRARGMTLCDALEALYRKYGYYKEEMLDIYMEGLDGIERRRRVMERLREEPPALIGGSAVVKIGDYAKGSVTDLLTGVITPTGLVSSDVLYYTLESGNKVIIRPSGTEPKIKIYFLFHGEDPEQLKKTLADAIADAKCFAE